MDRSGGLSPSLRMGLGRCARGRSEASPASCTCYQLWMMSCFLRLQINPLPPPGYSPSPGLTGVGFLKTCENGRKTKNQDLPLLDRRGVRRTGWLIAHRAKNRSGWVFFRRFQSTTPVPSGPGGELILPPRCKKPTPVSSPGGELLGLNQTSSSPR